MELPSKINNNEKSLHQGIPSLGKGDLISDELKSHLFLVHFSV